jgi:LPXTG-motif cell wall-anchored protein
MALAPADPQERYVFIPIEESQEQFAALPKTASFLPLFGLLGGMSLLLGGWLTAIRHRRH